MAEMPSWDDVIRNPNQYPDEMLRRDVPEVAEQLIRLRQTVVPKETMSQEVNAWRQQAAAAQEAQRKLEQQITYLMAGTPPGQEPAPAPASFDYSADPYIKPLAEQTTRALTAAEQNAQMLKRMEQMQAEIAKSLAQIPVAMTLDKIHAQDPSIDPANLLKFAQEKRLGDLNDAYRLMTLDTQVAKAKEAGMQEGIEKARQEAMMHPQVPYAPYGGSPSTVNVPTPGFETIDAAENAAVLDPEIVGLFYSQG